MTTRRAPLHLWRTPGLGLWQTARLALGLTLVLGLAPALAVPAAAADVDEDARAGTIPGYKRAAGLSLSPEVPMTPAPPAATSLPYFAPSRDDEWRFRFSGYVSAALRLSSGEREDPAPGQNTYTLHAPPRIVDYYGAFNGTNALPGSWVDLHFEYGNETVSAHVNVTTWRPTAGAAYTDVRSQNLLDQAYLQYRVDLTKALRLNATVGAFRNAYGGLGRYGAGQYNTFIIGTAGGVGATSSLEYDVGGGSAWILETGLFGGHGKPLDGTGPSLFDAAQTSSDPSSFVYHGHLGYAHGGGFPWVVGLHYMLNWSQDETGQVDDPMTADIDEAVRPDGSIQILGADFKMTGSYLGDLAVAVARMDARDAVHLKGMGFFGATDGEQVSRRFLGGDGGGNGAMWVGGIEYTLSWARLLWHPTPFHGEWPDLITSVFSNVGVVESDDPTRDGAKMYKFGADVVYQFFPWMGVSGRYDHVAPNTKDDGETFDVVGVELLFKSNWITHEQITIGYTRWFYGPRTHAEFPVAMPRDQLDEQLFGLHVGMWW